MSVGSASAVFQSRPPGYKPPPFKQRGFGENSNGAVVSRQCDYSIAYLYRVHTCHSSTERSTTLKAAQPPLSLAFFTPLTYSLHLPTLIQLS